MFCSVAELLKFVMALLTVVVMKAKELLWAEAVVIDMLVAELVLGAVAAGATALEFAVAVPQSVDVLEDVLAHALANVAIGIPPDIGVEDVAELNVGIFAVAMAVLEFAMSTPLREFNC